MHAWLPSGLTLASYDPGFVAIAYNMPSWFVSVLAGYWLLEPAAYRLCAGLARTPHGTAWAVALLISWVLLWPFARCPLTWGLQPWNTIEVLTYVHIYVCGAFAAFVLHARTSRRALTQT